MGNAGMISAKVAGEVAEMGNAFGYGAEQAGKTQAALQSMGVEAGVAADMQREIAAEALKAGVNVGTVMSDIAESAGTTAKFFGGNVKALKKAAIEAAKLGMSIADMASISDKLLDFESSISAQFEFQALSGKQINLDKARQLALEGNIAGATKEVLSQVGDIHDFNRMSVLERQKLAEATGMEVDQLQKTLAIQSALPNATQAQLDAVNQLGLSAAQIQEMGPEELQNRLEQAQAQEKLNKSIANMKADLMKALLPLGQAFAQVFTMLSPVLKVISGIFKGIGAFIQGMLAPIQYVFKTFSFIKDEISSILESFGILQPLVDALGIAFDFIKNTLMIAGGILTIAFLPQIMAAIPAALSLAGSFIASAIPAIMTGFGMIPFGLGIPLALGAIGAMIGMASGYMSDGIVSPQAGGSGFGKRVLFGPEGAISFNNKDTIVAGTNLNYGSRMNDGVIAPKGALKVNDYASDMPDPPEAKVVGITMEAATKIGKAIAMGEAATALIPRPVVVMNPVLPVFETNPLLMMGTMFSGVTSAIGGLFGGQTKEETAVTMNDVIDAISNIEINLDGKKVSNGVRVAGSFVKRG